LGVCGGGGGGGCILGGGGVVVCGVFVVVGGFFWGVLGVCGGAGFWRGVGGRKSVGGWGFWGFVGVAGRGRVGEGGGEASGGGGSVVLWGGGFGVFVRGSFESSRQPAPHGKKRARQIVAVRRKGGGSEGNHTTAPERLRGQKKQRSKESQRDVFCAGT